ncbi:MAG TPA: fumarylacetoacetate hydrolase family protein, partial [Bacteroidia bacterium]|nr:fumarylacetoacetate hydrolase family protein [Bacteroidia bacterium]
MKLVTYQQGEKAQLGILINDAIYNLHELDATLPDNMKDFLWAGEETMNKAKAIDADLKSGNKKATAIAVSSVKLLAPVPQPTSCRDGYAFRQHVAAARRNRKVPMIEEFDQYPIFYFTNHNAVQGPGEVVCMPDHFEKLD